MIKKHSLSAPLVISSFLLFLIFPAIGFIWAVVFWCLSRLDYKYAIIPVFLGSLLFALFSSTKYPVSDLLTYHNYYYGFKGVSLNVALENLNSDFVFYAVSWLLSNYVSSSGNFFTFFWTFLTYIFFGSSLAILFRAFSGSRLVFSLSLIYLFFIGLDLSVVNHLVRNVVALSMVSLSFSLLVLARHKIAFFLFFIALLIHFFVIIFIVIYLMYYFRGKFNSRLVVLSMLLVASVIGFYPVDYYLNFMGGGGLLSRAYEYQYSIPGEYNWRFYYERLVFVVAILSVLFLKGVRNIFMASVFLAYYISLLFMFRNSDVFLIRTMFSIPLVLVVSFSLIRLWTPLFFVLLALSVLAPIRFVRSIGSSDSFEYVVNDWGFLFLSFMDYFY